MCIVKVPHAHWNTCFLFPVKTSFSPNAVHIWNLAKVKQVGQECYAYCLQYCHSEVMPTTLDLLQHSVSAIMWISDLRRVFFVFFFLSFFLWLILNYFHPCFCPNPWVFFFKVKQRLKVSVDLCWCTFVCTGMLSVIYEFTGTSGYVSKDPL